MRAGKAWAVAGALVCMTNPVFGVEGIEIELGVLDDLKAAVIEMAEAVVDWLESEAPTQEFAELEPPIHEFPPGWEPNG